MSSVVLSPGFAGPRRVAAPRPCRQAAPVRLTRRGRVVLTLVFLGAFLAVLTALSAVSAATDHPGVPVPTRTVVVHSGDTLWGLASGIAAPGKVREMVIQIEELNALPSAELQAGQRIAVPAAR